MTTKFTITATDSFGNTKTWGADSKTAATRSVNLTKRSRGEDGSTYKITQNW